MSATETTATGGGPTAGDNVIEVQDLHVTFAGHVGLGRRDLAGRRASRRARSTACSFELRRGEVLALAGESGCGKTTTARAIMGLQEVNEGTILFEGEPDREEAAGVPAAGPDGVPGSDRQR